MNNIIYLCDRLDNFKKIEPLIREICLSAGGTDLMATEVIMEYKIYFEQLSALSEKRDLSASLNHACHIILGLLIKERL
ncbi:hypothetical protein [Psychromonas hadalis]|uniref:hypothetical protein n=1 Tax=Psychromonas hadalis TaxID=211669 RepID=UPI0003B5836A|nr:hypothetical protein [Psychromonas hadalis]